MKSTSHQNPAPAGYSRVCPYLMTDNIDALLSFLKQVLDVEITERLTSADGTVRHAEVRLGDSVIMVGKEQSGYPKESMTYVFVADADATFKKAMQHGATSIMEPGDRFYGYREGGFKDPSGNQWWVAEVVENVSKEEMERRAASHDFKPAK
jgi:PhnB protein